MNDHIINILDALRDLSFHFEGNVMCLGDGLRSINFNMYLDHEFIPSLPDAGAMWIINPFNFGGDLKKLFI